MSLVKPVSPHERNLSGPDFFLLWAGAAVSLAEIWAGGTLVPLGFIGGLLVILIGHLIGNTPMAVSGLIGSRHGVPAIISTRGALGNRGSLLPAVLNVVQLVGWTAVMLWVGGHAAASVTRSSTLNATGWIVIMGVLTTLWALGGHRFWKWLQRIGVVLLLALSVAMTWLVLKEYGLRGLLAVERSPELSFMLGLDLVIAMPISWMPLVSDYSRYARRDRSSLWGTWWGYFLVSSWMYAVGLCAGLATRSATPDAMVLDLMQARGLLAPALLIVLLSTFTTTFLDIYSNAVSMQSILPKAAERPLVVVGGALGTLIAVFFPATQYENFLLLIGSAFCPLFGVVLADYFLLKRGRYAAEDLFRKGRYWYFHGVNLWALGAWLGGFLLYQLAAHRHWPCGSSIPGMAAAALLYVALGRLTPSRGTPEE